MKTVKPNRTARRGGTLVIGVPRLQETFDELHKGGALVLQVEQREEGFGVRTLVLVAEDRLNEILHEMQDDGSIDREHDQNLN